MTPTGTTQRENSEPVILARLDIVSKQLYELDCKLDAMAEKYGDFMVSYTKGHAELEMVSYTKGHAELESRVALAIKETERAHNRIDTINKMVWAIALPVILGALGFLWAVATHAITVGTAP